MPRKLRLRGEQVEVQVTMNGVPVKSVTSVKSCEIEAMMDAKEEEFLGETTVRVDDIFKGVRFRLEVQLDTGDVTDLLQAIIGRARRDSAHINKKFDIKAICTFPNLQARTVSLMDVVFEGLPVNTGGRSEYSTLTLSGRGADFDIL